MTNGRLSMTTVAQRGPYNAAITPMRRPLYAYLMTIHLRAAAPVELDAINARYAAIGFKLSLAGELNVIAASDGAVAGQGRIVPIDAASGELGGIYVLPEHGGQGIARRIVAFLLARSIWPTLYCIPFAELAPFYQSTGFMPVASRVGVPASILEKLDWCNAAYDRPVLLLARHQVTA